MLNKENSKFDFFKTEKKISDEVSSNDGGKKYRTQKFLFFIQIPFILMVAIFPLAAFILTSISSETEVREVKVKLDKQAETVRVDFATIEQKLAELEQNVLVRKEIETAKKIDKKRQEEMIVALRKQTDLLKGLNKSKDNFIEEMDRYREIQQNQFVLERLMKEAKSEVK